MIVVACEIDLMLVDKPGSLKEKRRVIQSLKQRIKNQFEISVAEIGALDLWQRAVLGMACVSGQERQAQSIIQKTIDFIGRCRDVEIVNCDVQVY